MEKSNTLFPKKLLTTISTITLSLSLLLTPILTSPTLASEVNQSTQLSNQSQQSLSTKTIKPTKITLNSKTTTLNTGSTTTLIPTISPSTATNQNVTWKSSNTKIATVDSDGLITAIKAGKATITVTTVDRKKTAKCTVTVKTAPIITISYIPNITQTINQNDSYTLPSTVEVEMSDTSKKQLPITWNTSNVDTSIIGAYWFYGKVDGWNKDVKLTLVINENEKVQTIEEVQQLILGDWITSNYKIQLEFSNNVSLIQSYYYTDSWYSKDEIEYSIISPTEMKFNYIRWYDSSFDKWFISKDADKIFNFKINDKELTILNWSQYGGATFKKW